MDTMPGPIISAALSSQDTMASAGAPNPELSPLQLLTTMPTYYHSPTLSPTLLRREQDKVELKYHERWYLDEGNAKFLVSDSLNVVPQMLADHHRLRPRCIKS
jgi:hypothetical protein